MTGSPADDAAQAPSSLPQRHAARVLVLDAQQRVLLIRFAMQRSDGPFSFWAAPGGAIEAGEDAAGAAARELDEELGLRLPLHGPVHHARGVFEFEGRVIENHDSFFLARLPAGSAAPELRGATAAERELLRGWRWFDAQALAAETLPVFPAGLPGLLRRLAGPGDAGGSGSAAADQF